MRAHQKIDRDPFLRSKLTQETGRTQWRHYGAEMDPMDNVSSQRVGWKKSATLVRLKKQGLRNFAISKLRFQARNRIMAKIRESFLGS